MLTGRLQVSLFLLAAVVQTGVSAQSHQASDSVNISRIAIDARQIFDKSENVPFAGIVNLLHTRTREHVIRSELLFGPGMRVHRRRIDESARNLRALGIFSEVRIDLAPSSPDSAIAIVRTRDTWTTKINTSYRVQGGVQYLGMSVIEDNLLGYGKSLDVSYNQSSDRIQRQLQYRDRRLLGSRYNTLLKVQNSSDFDAWELLVARPFYSWTNRWGLISRMRLRTGHYRDFEHGELQGQPGLREEAATLILHRYAGGETKRLFFTGMDAAYTRIGPQRQRNLLFVAGAGLMRRTYLQSNNINHFGRTEDVPIGFAVQAAAGTDLRGTELGGSRGFGSIHVQYAANVAGHVGYAVGSAIHSFFHRGTAQDLVLRFEATAYRRTGAGLLAGRLFWAQLHNATVEQSLHLGGGSGLRGYPLRSRTGNRLLLLNVEKRLHSTMKVLFMRIGAAAFVDLGNAWELDERMRPFDLKGAVGMGLRIGNERLTGTVSRLDVAYNPAERRFRVSIGVGSYFSAVGRVNFLPGLRLPVPRAR